MSATFADTFFFLALLDERDGHHRHVSRRMAAFEGVIVTTRWVLVETANAFAGSRQRAEVAAFLRAMQDDPKMRIQENSDNLYERGLKLYTARPDKSWSLTDCISFVVMEQEGLREALTGDRHFAQAGFTPLFAE